MLLANYLVAQQLLKSVGPAAFIRHHPPPKPEGLAEFQVLASSLGIEDFNTGSALALQRSLKKLREPDPNWRAPYPQKDVYRVLMAMLINPMNVAQYAAAGALKSPENWAHYALSIPYYTHFTSPIRRYADVCVHRLLLAALDEPEAEKERCKGTQAWLASISFCVHFPSDLLFSLVFSSLLFSSLLSSLLFSSLPCLHCGMFCDMGMLLLLVLVSRSSLPLSFLPLFECSNRPSGGEKTQRYSGAVQQNERSVEESARTLGQRLPRSLSHEPSL
jgi:hypothetical protein